MDGLLSWERNAVDDLIARPEDKMFYRIAMRPSGGFSLWFIRRSDHPLGGVRNFLGAFESVKDAQCAAESYV